MCYIFPQRPDAGLVCLPISLSPVLTYIFMTEATVNFIEYLELFSHYSAVSLSSQPPYQPTTTACQHPSFYLNSESDWEMAAPSAHVLCLHIGDGSHLCGRAGCRLICYWLSVICDARPRRDCHRTQKRRVWNTMASRREAC